MANIATISVSLKANTSGFSKGVSKAKQDAKGFTAVVNVASKAVSSFGSAFKFAAANQGLGLLIRGFERLHGVAMRAFGAVTSAVGDAFDRIDALSKASVRLGVATDELARLQHAAKLAGVDSDTLVGSLSKLQVAINRAASDDTNITASAFGRLGLDAKQLGTLSVDAALRQVVKGFDGVTNATERAVIAQQLFGKSGGELLPLLLSGSVALEQAAKDADKLGLSVGTMASVEVEMANDAWSTFKEALAGAANTAAVELAPYLYEISNWLTDFVTDIGTDGPGIREMFADWAAEASSFAKSLADAVRETAKLLGLLSTTEDDKRGVFSRAAAGFADIIGDDYIELEYALGKGTMLSKGVGAIGRGLKGYAASSTPAAYANMGSGGGGVTGIANSIASTIESAADAWTVNDNERSAMSEIARLTAGRRDELAAATSAFNTIEKHVEEKKPKEEKRAEYVDYTLTPAAMRNTVAAVNAANRRLLPNGQETKKIETIQKMSQTIKDLLAAVKDMRPIDVAFD